MQRAVVLTVVAVLVALTLLQPVGLRLQRNTTTTVSRNRPLYNTFIFMKQIIKNNNIS